MSGGCVNPDHVQQSLAISSWLNIVQATLLGVTLVCFVWRQSGVERIGNVAEVASITQGRVLVVEEKIGNALVLVHQIERQIKELTAQVTQLQKLTSR